MGKSGGIGVCGLLGVAFVALKLAGVVDWPWLAVTLPFWGVPVAVLVVIGICVAVAGGRR